VRIYTDPLVSPIKVNIQVLEKRASEQLNLCMCARCACDIYLNERVAQTSAVATRSQPPKPACITS